MKIETLLFFTALLFTVNSVKFANRMLKTHRELSDLDVSNSINNPVIDNYAISGYIQNSATGQAISTTDLNNLGINVTFHYRNQSYAAIVDLSRGVYQVTVPAGVYQRSGNLNTYYPLFSVVKISADSSENDSKNTIEFTPMFYTVRGYVQNSATGQIISPEDLNNMEFNVKFSSANQNYIAIIDLSKGVYQVSIPGGVYQRSSNLNTFHPSSSSVNISENSSESDSRNTIVFDPIPSPTGGYIQNSATGQVNSTSDLKSF